MKEDPYPSKYPSLLHVKLSDVKLSAVPPEIIVRGEYTKGSGTRVVFISGEAKAAIEEWLRVREKYIKVSLQRNKGLIKEGGGNRKNENDNRLFPFSSTVVREIWSNVLAKAGLYERDSSTGEVAVQDSRIKKILPIAISIILPGGHCRSIDGT